MALPVIERIAAEILKRLDTLSIRGYEVVRPEREGKNLSPVNKKIVLRQQPSVANPTMSCHGNPPGMAFDVVFLAVCSVRNIYGNESAYDSAVNNAATEIISAITNPSVSPSTWYSMGGLALNSNVGATSPYISSEGLRAGVIVPIFVTFRVSEVDHTVARI